MVYETVVRALRNVVDEKVFFSADTEIFGDNSIIDSMDLVNAIMLMEELLYEDEGISIEIIDEAAIIGENSPFRTVGSLASHIESKLDR